MNIIVTGGCGFIGHHLVNKLLSCDDVAQVVVFDRMDACASTNHFDLSKPSFVLIRGDLRCRELVAKTLRRYNISHVMHLAAQSHVDQSFASPLDTVRCNLESTLTLLQELVAYQTETGVRVRTLLMSTDEVYGDAVLQNRTSGCDEHADFEPTNPYSASKAAAEMLGDVYGRAFNLDIVVPRCNNVYGPGQQYDKLVPRFIQLALQKQPFTVHGGGEQRRVWIHVKDAVEALWLILTKGQRYNIGTDQVKSVRQVAEAIHSVLTIQKNVQDDIRFVSIPDRPHNDQLYWIGYDKLKWTLGWDWTVPFTQGIEETVQWYCRPRVQTFLPRFKILLFGARGWIGGQFVTFLKQSGWAFEIANTRPGVDAEEAVFEEIVKTAPTHVVAILGRTHGWGVNTIDCFDRFEARPSNYRDNITAPLVLASCCRRAYVHFSYIGTGCIFQYDENHPVADPDCAETRYPKMSCTHDRYTDQYGFTESESGNFTGSDYVLAKTTVDTLFRTEFTDNVLNCRIRMPVSADWNARNLLHKLHHYDSIVDIPNSVTVFPEAFQMLLHLMHSRMVGTINLVNPGGLRHTEMLDMLYTQHPTLKRDHTIVQTSVQKTLQDRSNCVLNTNKLRQLCPTVRHAKTAVWETIQQMVF